MRFQGNDAEVARGIAEVLHNSGAIEVSAPETLKRIMDLDVSAFSAIAKMVLFLGIAAVALAVIGIYGVAAFAVGRRRKEFGIRMALGAMRVEIIHLILRSGARSVCSGLLLGICLSLDTFYGLAKLMKNAPFVLDIHDPLVYLVVCLLLILAATAATLIPALRATGADPVHALREE